MEIKKGKETANEILDVVAGWPEFAAKAKVSSRAIKYIGNFISAQPASIKIIQGDDFHQKHLTSDLVNVVHAWRVGSMLLITGITRR